MNRMGVPWALRARWRAFRRLGGDFSQPEVSSRSDALTQLWERNWPGAEPMGHLLRVRFPDRWVRFHSLPHGKTGVESSEELSEVLYRHLTVVRELQALVNTAELVVIAQDWGPNSWSGGWTKSLLPEAWPWRIFREVEDDEEKGTIEWGTHYFWIRSEPTAENLRTLLEAAADDRADIVIADAGMRWLYAPYYAGADVLLPDTPSRDEMLSRHTDWLSDHPSGL